MSADMPGLADRLLREGRHAPEPLRRVPTLPLGEGASGSAGRVRPGYTQRKISVGDVL